jgi:uncharacterized membrane protein
MPEDKHPQSRPEVSPKPTSGPPAPHPGPDTAPVTPRQQEVLSSLQAPVADEETAEEEQTPRVSTILGPLPVGVSREQTRSLNDAVHQILIVGLVISTFLLVAGLILDVIQRTELPAAALSPGEAFQRVLQLRPSGFLSLGLIVLMFTPVVRVIGSIIVFAWERDRRYMLVTLFVLAVMITSVVLGRG